MTVENAPQCTNDRLAAQQRSITSARVWQLWAVSVHLLPSLCLGTVLCAARFPRTRTLVWNAEPITGHYNLVCDAVVSRRQARRPLLQKFAAVYKLQACQCGNHQLHPALTHHCFFVLKALEEPFLKSDNYSCCSPIHSR